MKRKKRTVLCMCIALVSALLLTGWLLAERGLLVGAKESRTQEHLAKEVLRFHVLANSDSEEDQKVKMQVKEAVLAYLEDCMPRNNEKDITVEVTKKWVEYHLEDLEAVAENALRQAGSTDKAQAELVWDYFPAKTYGDVTFPAGEYEALRIKIGQAKGQNWWCCLYPNLCFVDAVHAVVPEEGKDTLRQVLDKEEYEMVTASDYKIKWFFFGGGSEKGQ